MVYYPLLRLENTQSLSCKHFYCPILSPFYFPESSKSNVKLDQLIVSSSSLILSYAVSSLLVNDKALEGILYLQYSVVLCFISSISFLFFL